MRYGKDRREAKRISHICEVECEGIGINRLATRITDLSTTGAFIDSMTCFTQGTILKIRFRLKDMFIETDCEVRYSMPQMGMGVRFLSLKPEYIAILEHFVEGKPLILPSQVEVEEEPPVEVEQPEPVASKHDSGLLGNFAIVSLFDIIQIIENNKLTGVLAVRSAVAGGEIHFNEGLIVGAKSGSTEGQNALVSFLGVTEGTFVFNGSETEYRRTIQSSSNMSLMLDLLRVKDEEAAFQ